jgi:hypothetical protein
MLALLPILLSLAPTLAEWLGGSKASAVAAQAINVVQAVTGSTDPEVIANLPPDKRAELQIKLAEIASEQRKAELSDMVNARGMASANPLIARAQVSFGAGILLVFGAIVLWMVICGAPTDQSGLFYYAMGILSAATTAVISFFFGSSTSGHSANTALAAALNRTPQGGSAAVATTGTVNVQSSTDELNTASLHAARGG